MLRTLELDVRAELGRILASELFARSERLSRLLRFIVGQTLEGKGDSLKEYVLGLEVFDRDTSFDPRADTIVRVQARRLRAALTEYYSGPGKDDPVIIDLPKGGYVPVFRQRERAGDPTRPRVHWKAIAGLFTVVLALLLVWLISSQTARNGIRSVAVLSFADLTPAKDQEYFCDGLAEEIINALSGIIHVVGRTSSFQFKGKDIDVRQIGRQLNVDAVLEGSVRKAGNRVRISVQLIRVSDGYHLWSATFERELTDVFSVQDEISGAVASRLKLQPPAKTRRTENAEAYELYLLGRFYWNKWTVEGFRNSIRFYQRSVAKDPNYAVAYAGMADAYGVLGHWGALPAKAAYAQKDEVLRKSLQLDPDLPEALVSLAMTKAAYEWDWAAAERLFRRALVIQPHSANTHQQFALVLSHQGRVKEAETEIRKALELEPLSVLIRWSAGADMYSARRYTEAVLWLEKALELDPNYARAHLYLGAVYTEKGEHARAIAELTTANRLAPVDPEAMAFLGYACARAGRRGDAQAILYRLKRFSGSRPVALHLADVYAGLGEKEPALESLEKAYDERQGRLIQLKMSPRYDSLRAEPRFQNLLKKLGLLGPAEP